MQRPLLVRGLLCLGLVAATGLAHAQSGQVRQSGIPGQSVTRSIPQHVLYRQFFAHLLFLDRRATELAAQNPSTSSKLRSYYQQKLHLKDSEMNSLRSIAAEVQTSLDSLDAQARQIIRTFRAQVPSGRPLTAQDIPALPKDLKTLQKRRNALIEDEVKHLQRVLGPQASTAVDAYLVGEFARNIRVQLVATPRQHDPAKNPIPGFTQEAK
jgi:hypothetical protein